jgi:plastocyanin
MGGGFLTPGTLSPDPTSPIPVTSTGTTIDVTFTAPGDYGYYCQTPDTNALYLGAVFVDRAASTSH